MGELYTSVEAFTAEDLARYLVRQGRRQGLIGVVSPAMVRACKRLLKEYESRCQLILALEHVLSTFAEVVGVNERLLTLAVVDIAVKELGGSNRPWEALYFQRFAGTGQEAEYFTLWLGVLEDTDEANRGSEPRLGEELYPTWEAVRLRAEAQLDQAVQAIRQRFKQRRELEEWVPESKEVGPRVARGGIIRMGDQAFRPYRRDDG